MFGIGRLKALERRINDYFARLHGVEDECGRLHNRIVDLCSALSLFARKCDECKEWKSKDAKGWMKRDSLSTNSWIFLGPDGMATTERPAHHTCPDCMAKLKPVDEEASDAEVAQPVTP